MEGTSLSALSLRYRLPSAGAGARTQVHLQEPAQRVAVLVLCSKPREETAQRRQLYRGERRR